jgi:hypothetical protein
LLNDQARSEVLEWKIGGGYYVRVTMPNAAPEEVQSFDTETQAARWIRNESSAWLHARWIAAR